MKIVKFLFLTLILTLNTTSLWGTGNNSVENNDAYINAIFDFRLELTCTPKSADCITKCDQKLITIDRDYQQKNISYETYLTAKNMITQEKYNFIYEQDMASPELEVMLTQCYKDIRGYMDEHSSDEANFSKYFYVMAGDIISSTLQYLPISKAMNEGLIVKKYYDQAITQDPNFCFALVNLAQWYYHAPSFAGGSKKKALELVTKASDKATSPYEIYYTNFILSQLYFENKDTALYEKAFALSQSAASNNRNLALTQKVNELGYSYFYYTTNRKKVDKELGAE